MGNQAWQPDELITGNMMKLYLNTNTGDIGSINDLKKSKGILIKIGKFKSNGELPETAVFENDSYIIHLPNSNPSVKVITLTPFQVEQREKFIVKKVIKLLSR